MASRTLGVLLTVAVMALPITRSAAESGDLKAGYARPSAIPFPADNPYSAAKAELGRMLFFDPRLSGANYISCASCHNPGLSWGDGLPRGIGHGMSTLARRSPTLLNLAWAELLMWDGRKVGLEDQALGPMSAPAEMHQDLDKLVDKLSPIEGYRRAFAELFPGDGMTIETLAKALATYERTIVSGAAPFDRWIAGDETAIPEAAKRGFVVFNAKGNCASCHTGWNFTDNGFHDIGLPDPDLGRGAIVPLPSMQHAVKTPTLRDAARRAPYMHDGSVPTLLAVVDHYDRGGEQRPSLADEIKPLHLSDQEKADLVAFMATLTGDNQPVEIPQLFPGPQSAQR